MMKTDRMTAFDKPLLVSFAIKASIKSGPVPVRLCVHKRMHVLRRSGSAKIAQRLFKIAHKNISESF